MQREERKQLNQACFKTNDISFWLSSPKIFVYRFYFTHYLSLTLLSIYHSIHLSIYVFVYLSIYLSLCPPPLVFCHLDNQTDLSFGYAFMDIIMAYHSSCIHTVQYTHTYHTQEKYIQDGERWRAPFSLHLFISHCILCCISCTSLQSNDFRGTL